MDYTLYHGANAKKLLFNIGRHGLTTDSEGKLYFSQFTWTNCLVHGTDSATGESYVVRVRVNVPETQDTTIDRSARSGNPDAFIVVTTPSRLLTCEFLEMHVRSGSRDDGFSTKTIPGNEIKDHLEKAVEKAAEKAASKP